MREGRHALGTALERAERFLGLAVLAAIVLAGVAVAMAVRRYSERHFDMSAMLRCLGATQRDILVIFLLQLVLIGLLGLGIAAPLAAAVWRHAGRGNGLQRLLAPNVALSLLMPVLIALGMML